MNPGRVEALREIARAYYADVADGANLSRVSEQFLVHVSDDPEVVLYMAQGRAKQSHYPVALEGLHGFLQRWREHEHAQAAREMSALLEQALEERMAAWDLPRVTAIQVMRDQELVSQWMGRGERVQAREAVDRVRAARANLADLQPLRNRTSVAPGCIAQRLATQVTTRTPGRTTEARLQARHP